MALLGSVRLSTLKENSFSCNFCQNQALFSFKISTLRALYDYSTLYFYLIFVKSSTVQLLGGVQLFGTTEYMLTGAATSMDSEK